MADIRWGSQRSSSYTERPPEAGPAYSIASADDSYHDALAQSTLGSARRSSSSLGGL
jgi:hypothetical protein